MQHCSSIAILYGKEQMKRKIKKRFINGTYWLVTLIIAIVILLPLYWVFISSVKPRTELFSSPIQWFPRNITFKSYETLIKTVGILPQIGNTLIITGISLLITTIICVMAAYAFERYKGKALSVVYAILVFSALIPQIVTARPLYDYLNKLLRKQSELV